MEWAQARGYSPKWRQLDLSGTIRGRIGELELHGDRYDLILLPDIFLQELGAGARTDRQNGHPVHRSVLLRPEK